MPNLQLKVKVKSPLCSANFLQPMDCSLYQASPYMGFSQARVMEWNAVSFSNWCYVHAMFKVLVGHILKACAGEALCADWVFS